MDLIKPKHQASPIQLHAIQRKRANVGVAQIVAWPRRSQTDLKRHDQTLWICDSVYFSSEFGTVGKHEQCYKECIYQEVYKRGSSAVSTNW